MTTTTKRTTDATVPAGALKAAARFAAKDIGRYAFNGVLVEPGRLVATNGKFLAMLTFKGAETDHNADGSLIVELPAIRDVLRLKPDTVRVNGKLDALRAPFKGADGPGVSAGAVAHTPLEGEFPHWQGIMPDPAKQSGLLKGNAVGFNPEFLRTVGLAAKDIGLEKLTFAPDGIAGAGLYHGETDEVELTAVVMPITS